MIPVRIRPMHPSDMAFVCSSWKQSLAASLPRGLSTRVGPTRQGWSLVNHVVDNVSLPRCLVLVAFAPANDDGPELLCAWLAVQGPRLTYGFVKPRYRGMGIFRQLRDEAPNAVWSGYDPFLELERREAVPCHES